MIDGAFSRNRPLQFIERAGNFLIPGIKRDYLLTGICLTRNTQVSINAGLPAILAVGLFADRTFDAGCQIGYVHRSEIGVLRGDATGSVRACRRQLDVIEQARAAHAHGTVGAGGRDALAYRVLFRVRKRMRVPAYGGADVFGAYEALLRVGGAAGVAA